MSAILLAVFLIAAPAVETRFEQVVPPPALKTDADASPRRTPGVGRAVVLLHGFRPQPVSTDAARKAESSYWELPDRPVVKTLAKDSDVYAFHYSQTATVDEVARAPSMARMLRQLREAGYFQVVLVGYSAGGVVARLFVEQAPAGGGVTKVVQVCAPNGGTEWTFFGSGVRAVQAPFIKSLAKDARAPVPDRRIPIDVEFVCLVGYCNTVGDGVVRRDSQWTAELQEQGIPAEAIFLPHVGAMHSSRLSLRIADAVRAPQPRWTAEQVNAARGKVLGLLAVVKGKP